MQRARAIRDQKRQQDGAWLVHLGRMWLLDPSSTAPAAPAPRAEERISEGSCRTDGPCPWLCLGWVQVLFVPSGVPWVMAAVGLLALLCHRHYEKEPVRKQKQGEFHQHLVGPGTWASPGLLPQLGARCATPRLLHVDTCVIQALEHMVGIWLQSHPSSPDHRLRKQTERDFPALAKLHALRGWHLHEPCSRLTLNEGGEWPGTCSIAVQEHVDQAQGLQSCRHLELHGHGLRQQVPGQPGPWMPGALAALSSLGPLLMQQVLGGTLVVIQRALLCPALRR